MKMSHWKRRKTLPSLPQVGGGWDVAEETSEERVPALIRYVGLSNIGVLSRFNPEIGFIGGVWAALEAIYIAIKKEELKKAESGNLSNSDAKSKNSEV